VTVVLWRVPIEEQDCVGARAEVWIEANHIAANGRAGPGIGISIFIQEF